MVNRFGFVRKGQLTGKWLLEWVFGVLIGVFLFCFLFHFCFVFVFVCFVFVRQLNEYLIGAGACVRAWDRDRRA